MCWRRRGRGRRRVAHLVVVTVSLIYGIFGFLSCSTRPDFMLLLSLLLLLLRPLLCSSCSLLMFLLRLSLPRSCVLESHGRRRLRMGFKKLTVARSLYGM